MKARGLWLGMLSVLLLPCVARAQNNTAANAAAYMVNEGWITANMGAAPNNERWYRYAVFAGRSYCAEGITERAPTSIDHDGETSVFRLNGTVLIGRGDNNVQEPGGGDSSIAGNLNPGRVCYVAPATELNFIRVGNSGLTPTVTSYQWRVVETTQFCPWFFSGGGFESFVLIKNTSNTPVRVRVTLRSTTGAALGTLAGTAPANGSLNLQVSDPAGFNLPSASGSVEIAYGTDLALGVNSNDNARGGPGGVIANVTSISFSGGVSFDTPAAPRQDFLR